MDEGGTTSKTGIHCRGCDYDLRESAGRCPECGRPFDAGNPKTYFTSPRSWRMRRRAKRILLLLLLVTLPPALGLGWLAWGWREDQQHIAALQGTGWKVRQLQPIHPGLRRYLPRRWAYLADRAYELWPAPQVPAEEDWRHIAGLKHLRSVYLWPLPIGGAQFYKFGEPIPRAYYQLDLRGITDESLTHLAGLRRLQKLQLYRTSITGRGLLHLAGMTQLQELGLEEAPLEDAGLAHLAGLRELRVLHVTDTPVTDAGIKHLAGLTQMKKLGLSGTKVGDEGLRNVAGMINLEELRLNDTAITDAGLEHLMELQKLKSLHLNRTHVTPAGIERLRKALPQLRVWHAP